MKQSVRLAVSLGLLLAALVLLQSRTHGEAVPLRRPLDTFPTALGSWYGREATVLDVEVLNILKVKDYLMRRYVDQSGRSLWLYIGYWDTQRKGAQVHSPRNCLPGSGWEPVQASVVHIPVHGGQSSIPVNRFLIQKDSHQEVVFYWYQAQGRAIAGEVGAKVAMVQSAILRNRTDGALVRVSSPIYKSLGETSDLLTAYIQTMHPLLSQYLPD